MALPDGIFVASIHYSDRMATKGQKLIGCFVFVNITFFLLLGPITGSIIYYYEHWCNTIYY